MHLFESIQAFLSAVTVPIFHNPIDRHLDIVRKPFVGCKPSRLFQDPTNVIEPGRGPAFKSIICIFDTNYAASECQQMFDFVQNTIGSGNMMKNTKSYDLPAVFQEEKSATSYSRVARLDL